MSYTDTAGDHHVIGLVDVTVRHPHSASPYAFAGDVIEITSFGISVGRTAQGGYITAGYNRDVSAVLRNNALVVGNPIDVLSQTEHEQPGEAK